jgi:hypothetical protein
VVEHTMDVTSWLRKRLEQASPDLLRAMVQDFAEALMGAEADALYGAGYGRALAGASQHPQRLPRARLGHARGHDRARDPEAPPGQLLPRLACCSRAGGQSRRSCR